MGSEAVGPDAKAAVPGARAGPDAKAAVPGARAEGQTVAAVAAAAARAWTSAASRGVVPACPAEARAAEAGCAPSVEERLVAAARSQRDEAEERLETLRAAMQAQLMSLTREHEGTLASLEAHRAQRSPELHASEVRHAAAEREATELRAQLQACRGELSEARASTERLQVQAQLEHGGATSRARENAQQLAHKEAQTHALERELSASAGQLVAAQAEVRQLSGAAEQQQEAARRERSVLTAAQQGLEADKDGLLERLRAAEAHRQALTDQLAQSAGDREFCFDIIGELKAQLGAARGGARPRSPPPPGGAAQEVRL